MEVEEGKSTLSIMKRLSNVFPYVSFSSNSKTSQANGTSFVQLLQGALRSGRMVRLLPFHTWQRERGMMVERFAKRTCCKVNRSGATVRR